MVDRRLRRRGHEGTEEAGILLASGLIGGAAVMGVVIAALIYVAGGFTASLHVGAEWLGPAEGIVSLLVFLALAAYLYRRTLRAAD